MEKRTKRVEYPSFSSSIYTPRTREKRFRKTHPQYPGNYPKSTQKSPEPPLFTDIFAPFSKSIQKPTKIQKKSPKPTRKSPIITQNETKHGCSAALFAQTGREVTRLNSGLSRARALLFCLLLTGLFIVCFGLPRAEKGKETVECPLYEITGKLLAISRVFHRSGRWDGYNATNCRQTC